MSRFKYTSVDHAASDDLPEILEYTRQLHEKRDEAGSSSRPAALSKYNHDDKSARIQARVADLAAEILACQAEMEEIQQRMDRCIYEKDELEKQLTRSRTRPDAKEKGKAVDGINYMTEQFDWQSGLHARMKKIFGIDSFRLCQQGVCNANMDGRDIVCIMPTGGGKSLTYQLPALLTPGCTLVISPLISLMTDQILHLKEANIEAVMITSAASKQEKTKIISRLHQLAERKTANEEEIKLCYVTPEKLSKDASFKSLLQKLDAAGKFARIVIDEAHCVSQLGHDFRPDYQKLRELRQLYLRVPIMALSATCGPQVLQDLIKILGLRPVVDGTDANADGTVYFSSPLYRKNLHYRVVAKADKASDQLETMKDYILEHHPNDSGIIYCFTVKDTEFVAQKLSEISSGKIKTGVYHAHVQDTLKHNLHQQWRKGIIKVVCATIAFGLGIDKGDVRFVLHHSISKSLEGFYQESGRAGRDGKDSDCVLYYRPQDCSVIGAVTSSEKEGVSKLHSMVNFAEDLTECRKIQFAEYFSHSSQLSITSWTTEDTGALERCGHCDNCNRDPETVELKDFTVATWQILKIAEHVRRTGGKLTLGMLANLARGLKGGTYEANQGKRSKTKEKMTLDLDEISGGSVDLSRNDIEHLLVRLLTRHYLQEEYVVTAYSRLIYLQPGRLAPTLTRHPKQSLQAVTRRLEFHSLKGETKGKRKAKDPSKPSVPKKRKSAGSTSNAKGKNKAVIESDDDLFDSDDPIIVPDSDELELENAFLPRPSKPVSRSQPNLDNVYASGGFEGSDEDDAGWLHSMRDEPPSKRRKTERIRSKKVNIIREGDNEVMILSSD